MSPLVLLIIIAVFIVILLGGAIYFFRALQRGGQQRARERFPMAKAIINGANFFGQESLGATQARGNGTLVLTDTELFFERWVARREYHIPLKDIQSLETVSSHLGKWVGQPLLKVTFRNEAGQTDSIAWYVPDVEGLKATIEAARR